MSSVTTLFQPILGADQMAPWSSLNDSRFKVSRPDELTVVFPESLEQLSAVVRTCHEQRWRLLICGQRTKLRWGCRHELNADVVVSTARLRRIVTHWVDDFTIRVEAGMGLADLQATLAQQGQFWPVDALHGSKATVGGIVATGDGGSLRQRYGSVRDTVIGIQFVRYDGEVVKAGGRVVKNVAGYDLMKLMTGAYGTLGVLSQITLRLYPVAPQSQTVVLSGGADAVAAAALQTRLQGITPVAMDIIGTQKGLQLAGQFQGIAAGVEEQVQRFEAIAQQARLTSQLVEDAEFWPSLAAQLGKPESVLCKVGLLPTQLVPLLQKLEPLTSSWLGRLHNGSGLGLIALDAQDPRLEDTVKQLRSHCEAHRGYLTILQAPPTVTLEPWGYRGNALGTMKAIKQKFDPEGLLNPGGFVGGI